MKTKEGLDKSPSFLYYITMIHKRTLLKWSEIFGIEMEDLDGFPTARDQGLSVAFTLEEFLQGISFCTVRWVNLERYKVLDSLLS